MYRCFAQLTALERSFLADRIYPLKRVYELEEASEKYEVFSETLYSIQIMSQKALREIFGVELEDNFPSLRQEEGESGSFIEEAINHIIAYNKQPCKSSYPFEDMRVKVTGENVKIAIRESTGMSLKALQYFKNPVLKDWLSAEVLQEVESYNAVIDTDIATWLPPELINVDYEANAYFYFNSRSQKYEDLYQELSWREED